MKSHNKVLICSVAAALIAGTGMSLSQRVTLFHDHQGVTEASSSNTPVIALQTPGDMAYGSVAYHRPWTATIDDFRHYGEALGTKVAGTVRRLAGRDRAVAEAQRQERLAARHPVERQARPVQPAPVYVPPPRTKIAQGDTFVPAYAK